VTGVPVAANFLAVKNRECLAHFIWGLRLLFPITRRVFIVVPPNQIGRNYLRHTAANAALVLHIEVAGSGLRLAL
jgi:hypothetical protein